MRPLLTFLFIALFSVTGLQAQNWGWGREKIKGNRDVTTQRRDLSGFDGIKACCNFKVELTQGATFSVEIRAESNLMEYIKTRVSGSTLELGFVEDVSVNTNEDIFVYITLPELELVDVSSSAEVITVGSFTGDRLKLESSSGSSMKIMYSGKTLIADASSGSGIEVKGSVQNIDAEASSGAQIHAENMEANSARADVSSGAGIDLQAIEKLDAEASSGGRVRYKGDPSSSNTKASSGGSIRKG